MDNKLNELRDLKEMYEARLKSANVDKSLTNHYQLCLIRLIKKLRKIKFFEDTLVKDWKSQRFALVVIKKCHHMRKNKRFNACETLSK